MPQLLKDIYDEKYVKRLADSLAKQKKGFRKKAFIDSVFNDSWNDKELKSRMTHISEKIHEHLDCNYKESATILSEIAPEFTGYHGMFIPHFVETHGLGNWKLSLETLEKTTEFCSAEFAIRQFILKDQQRAMKQMLIWSKNKNEHVRRLSSEGSRPRLPWACALPDFKQDPRPILPILDSLKSDESIYVRKSVANNINDISKDNPDITLDLIRLWKGDNQKTDWILKHGARTLLKKGNTPALRLFGKNHPSHVHVKNFKADKKVKIGEDFNFSFLLSSQKPLGEIRIEYKIVFQRKSGKGSGKVFQLGEKDIENNSLSINKKHSFKQLSTRKHYPGAHQVILLVNGVALEKADFQVIN